jgi:hypothetical protein
MQYLQGLKTLIGIFIAAVPTVLSLAGYDVAVGFSDEAVKLLEDGVTIIGLCIAFYGRLVAQAPGWFAKHAE